MKKLLLITVVLISIPFLIVIFWRNSENNIKEDYVIVKGASIKEDNVELIKARELGLKIYEYNELVGEISKKFKSITYR